MARRALCASGASPAMVFQKFQSPALGGYAVTPHCMPREGGATTWAYLRDGELFGPLQVGEFSGTHNLPALSHLMTVPSPTQRYAPGE
jgi:hypothetical protein